MMKMMIGVAGGLHRESSKNSHVLVRCLSLSASVSLQVEENFWAQWVTNANLFTQRYCSSPPPPQY